MDGLRQLSLSDLDDGLALSTASGWNQTAADWHRLLTLPTITAWGIEQEGHIVATAAAIRYGSELAWIGMVLTAEPHRGRGLASKLMAAALDHLTDCALIKLDATAQGAPLYRRFGFADEGPIVRYIGRPPGHPVHLGGTPGPDAFEADRSALLSTFDKPACLEDGSFAYTRPGRVLPFFGPCVGQGEPLLGWFAAQQPGEFLLDRTGEPPEGFRAARQLVRMYRGKLKATHERQYSTAGFEFG